MIEKNIFQTWKSKSDIPADFSYWSDTVRKFNPQFVYYFWDDLDNRNFIATNYPWFLKTYDAYPLEIYRVDAVRYFWLYHFGGVYIDMDCECLRSLDQLCSENTGVVLGRMGTKETFEHSIPNAVMMSSSREEFWLYVFHLLMALQEKEGTPEWITGPVVLKTAVDALNRDRRDQEVQAAIDAVRSLLPPELRPRPRVSGIRLAIDAVRSFLTRQPGRRTGPSGIRILPPEYFYPINWDDPSHQDRFRRPIIRDGKLLSKEQANGLFPHSYIVSYWAHSWETEHWLAE